MKMVYAYRLKKTDDAGRVVEGFSIRHTWQYSSNPKAEALSKWPMVAFLQASDIKALKAEIDKYEKGAKESKPGNGDSSPDPALMPDANLSEKLNAMNLSELKQYAKENGFPESEYSTFTRSKLIEYLLLAKPERK